MNQKGSSSKDVWGESPNGNVPQFNNANKAMSAKERRKRHHRANKNKHLAQSAAASTDSAAASIASTPTSKRAREKNELE